MLDKQNHNTNCNWGKLDNDMLAEEHNFEEDLEENNNKKR